MATTKANVILKIGLGQWKLGYDYEDRWNATSTKKTLSDDNFKLLNPDRRRRIVHSRYFDSRTRMDSRSICFLQSANLRKAGG
jgi:hypothetical protein